MLNKRLPDEFLALVQLALLLVLEVQSAEEPGIEAHVSEETRVGIGMSERIHLPPDARSHPELLHQELMSNHHVVNLVLIVSAGLVMHAPAGIHELQTPLLDELAYLVFHGRGLKAPPHAEEFHLYIGEVLRWVI